MHFFHFWNGRAVRNLNTEESIAYFENYCGRSSLRNIIRWYLNFVKRVFCRSSWLLRSSHEQFSTYFFLLLRMLCLSLYNQAGYWQMQGSYATGLVCLCSPWKNRYDGILSGFLKVRFIYFVVFYWTWCSSQKKDNSDIIIYIHFLFFILLFSVGFVNMPYLCI